MSLVLASSTVKMFGFSTTRGDGDAIGTPSREAEMFFVCMVVV